MGKHYSGIADLLYVHLAEGRPESQTRLLNTYSLIVPWNYSKD